MSDPLADMQNVLGYQGLVGPNPYLKYQGAIPMAGYYTGTAGELAPTDATGKPIQSFVDYNNNAQAQYQQALAAYNAQQATPGTTLNSAPGGGGAATSWPGGLGGVGAYQYPAAGLGGMSGRQPLNPASAQAMYQGAPPASQAQFDAMGMVNALGGSNSGVQGSGRGTQNAQGALDQAAALAPILARQYAARGQQQTSQGPTPPAAPDLRQAYLNALANPGPVPTYGAAGPQPGQAATGSAQQPSVIQSFLAAHPGGGTTGGGGYNNTGFFNTLRQLQGSTA